MKYTGPQMVLPHSVALSSYSRDSLGPIARAHVLGAPSSATWPAANRTIYVPFWIHQPMIAYRMWCLNGGTVGTNTVTAAIYTADSSHLPASNVVEASATSAGANALQFFDITDTMLGNGLWYMALALDGTTATVFRASFGVTALATQCIFTQESNTPSTATPVAAANTQLPLFGVSLRASI